MLYLVGGSWEVVQIEEKIRWAKRFMGLILFIFLNNFDLCINIGGRVLCKI